VARPYLTKQAYIYGELRRRIDSGEMKPGTVISTQAIAREYGVSTIPVREALKQLESEDLIAIEPHKPGYVKGVTIEEAIWIAELRLMLEPEALRLAGPHLEAEALQRLSSILNELDAAVERADNETFSSLNLEFHGSIYNHCPNRRLVSLIETLRQDAHRFDTFKRFPGSLSESQLDHHRIFHALEGGEFDVAAKETAGHRQRIAERLRRWSRDAQPT
jgi:DNA-binding GntR family transcriptional regulator